MGDGANELIGDLRANRLLGTLCLPILLVTISINAIGTILGNLGPRSFLWHGNKDN